jgi:superkiller protein 3
MSRQNIITKNGKLIFLLIFCVVAGCSNKADSYNKKGISLYNRGRYTEAIAEFKKTLELDPHHYDAHYHLGIAYYAKGMTDEAITELKKAIEVNPAEPKAHYNIAFAYVTKENVAEALAEYRKAIELFAARKDKKKEAEGYLYMAVAYSLIEKNEDAFLACKKALEINPDLEGAHYFLGVCYYKKNMIDDAIAAFKKVIQLNPKSEKAHNLLFTIYDKLGRIEEAAEEDRILKQIARERMEQR